MCADIAGNSEVQSLDQPAASNTVRTMGYINQVEALILGGILIAALLFFAVLYREDDDWRVAQSVVTVALLLRNIFLGLVGGVATLLALSLVALLFWDPFWRALRNTSWIWVHDVGYTYFIVSAPTTAAVGFAAAFAIIDIVERIRKKGSLAIEVALGIVLPFATALSMTVQLNPRIRWSFPGTELAVALVGWLLVWLRHRTFPSAV
jgi:hypothetical protein